MNLLAKSMCILAAVTKLAWGTDLWSCNNFWLYHTNGYATKKIIILEIFMTPKPIFDTIYDEHFFLEIVIS